MMVNNFTNNNKASNHLSPQINENKNKNKKRNHNIWLWKSSSWLGICTNMWRS